MGIGLNLQIAPFGLKDGNANPPNQTQERILEWVDNIRALKTRDRIYVLYLQGGVGSGKSRGVLAPVLEMLCEIPGLRALWGRHDFKDLKLSIMDKFFEIVPPELFGNKSEQYHWYDVRQSKGQFSRIYFNQLKDIGGLGSQEFGLILVTEAHETTYQAYCALKRRCRQDIGPNIIILESEPPNEDHWLAALTDPKREEYDTDVEKWELSTYENWGNLPQAYTSSLEKMPEAWKKKYLLGKCGFIPDGKPFYQGFKLGVHVGEFEFNQYKDLVLGWDFGFHHPAVVFSQFDDFDRWVLLREMIGTDITIDKFADEVAAFINVNFPQARCVHYGDPACIQVSDKSEETSYKILLAKNILINFRQSEYRLRKEIIEQKLATLNNGRPQLLVDRRCKIIIDGFLGGYHYPDRRPGQQDGVRFEMPFKDGYYEHPMNAMEYIAVNRFSPVHAKTSIRTKPRARVLDNI